MTQPPRCPPTAPSRGLFLSGIWLCFVSPALPSGVIIPRSLFFCPNIPKWLSNLSWIFPHSISHVKSNKQTNGSSPAANECFVVLHVVTLLLGSMLSLLYACRELRPATTLHYFHFPDAWLFLSYYKNDEIQETLASNNSLEVTARVNHWKWRSGFVAPSIIIVSLQAQNKIRCPLL